MPRFRYKALNRWGDPLTGEREATDRAALAEALAAEGLELREAEALPDEPGWVAPEVPPADARLVPRPAVGGADVEPGRHPTEQKWGEIEAAWVGAPPRTRPDDRLSEAEARELAEQLAALSSAGLPLHSGLRAAAEEVREGALRRALLTLAGDLERGRSPEEALDAAGGRLPGHLRGLVLAAARSGRVGTVLGEFVRYAQIGASLRRTLWLSLIYPAMLVGFLGVVFLFTCTVVVPSFKSIYQDFGIELPMLTWSLIAASDAVQERGPALAALTLLGLIVIWIAARLLLDPPTRRRWLCAIPLFGPLWRWTALAEFAHYLGLLVDCELTLARSLPLAARGARDPELEWACARIADEVAAGRPLSEALGWWRAIPGGLVKLLRWSEGHQSLGEALHMAGALFEARAQSQTAFIGAVSVVTAVVLVVWGAGFLVVALFLPLIRLISALSG